MTEPEWLAATYPERMLKHISGRATDRKLRLFACACCRRIRDQLSGRWSRMAVECAERFADGGASNEELRSAYLRARKLSLVRYQANGEDQSQYPLLAAADAAARSALTAALSSAVDASWSPMRGDPSGPLRPAERAAQAGIVRDIFGNPFRPITFNPHWRTADTVAMARGIYEDRAFDRLPLLADALMDAGCDEEQLLAHCRSDGPHVRGCWAVDLVLGKE